MNLCMYNMYVVYLKTVDGILIIVVVTRKGVDNWIVHFFWTTVS